MSQLEKIVAAAASRAGLTVARSASLANQLPPEATDSDRRIIDAVRPFTMTSPQRIWTLLKAVEYTVQHDLPGDFAECGVWRGGSVMAMALQLKHLGVKDRTIWLYDTYAGMTTPTERDVEAASGQSAAHLMETTAVGDGNNVWAYASKQDVVQNLGLTAYPLENFHLVEGDVAQTLKFDVPESVSLLRLDTDWYESTKMCLDVLYPRLAVGGPCILDDYGHWQGARDAVDEYFAATGRRPLMMPIDFGGRVFVKTD